MTHAGWVANSRCNCSRVSFSRSTTRPVSLSPTTSIGDDFSKESIDIVVNHGISGPRPASMHTHRRGSGMYPQSLGSMSLRARRRASADRCRQADPGCVYRKLQRQIPQRMPQRTLVQDAHRGARRAIINGWRANYNQHRSHSALNYQTPAESDHRRLQVPCLEECAQVRMDYIRMSGAGAVRVAFVDRESVVSAHNVVFMCRRGSCCYCRPPFRRRDCCSRGCT
jgi:hypothetical protein